MPSDPTLQRMRRIHALEHATIHVLSARHPRRFFAGRSDRHGFIILGKATLENITSAAASALKRLQDGEKELAYHPNCGTNLVVAGLLAGTASFLTTISFRDKSWKDRLEQLPTVVAVTTLTLLAAQPLARLAQERVTTNADPGTMQIVRVEPVSLGGKTAHRVIVS